MAQSHTLGSASMALGDVTRSRGVDEGGRGSRPSSSKQHKKEKMSVKVLLAQAGLGQYYPLFEKAGYQMLEGNLNMSDIQVEQMLSEVERQCHRRFPADVRMRLWKALRYMWFQLSGHDKPFIDHTEVPRLFLPKRDYKQIDWMVKFLDLDPDRQRQIVRTTKSVQTLQGKVIETQQFEVYRRQQDLWYEFKDMQRSVQEWTHMNARMMLREDPREEVLKLRIRSIIDRAHIALTERNSVMATQRLIMNILLGIRIVSATLVILMFTVSYLRFRETPVEIVTHFMLSSKQFISGISYIIVFAVAWVVAQRRRDDPHIARLKRLIISSERLTQQISDFRVESEELRMANAEAPKPAEVPPMGQRLAQQQQPAKKPRELKRRKKKKREKDPMLALWAPDLSKTKVNMESIAKALPAAYRALDPLPDDFRRVGGERMLRFTDRLGNRLAGVDEDQLATRVIGRPDKFAALPGPGFDLPKLPDGQPRYHMSEMPELPELPPISHRSGGELPPRPEAPPPVTAGSSCSSHGPTPSHSPAHSPRRPLLAPPEPAQEAAAQEGRPENAHDAASLYPWVPGAVASEKREQQARGQPRSRSPSPDGAKRQASASESPPASSRPRRVPISRSTSFQLPGDGQPAASGDDDAQRPPSRASNGSPETPAARPAKRPVLARSQSLQVPTVTKQAASKDGGSAGSPSHASAKSGTQQQSGSLDSDGSAGSPSHSSRRPRSAMIRRSGSLQVPADRPATSSDARSPASGDQGSAAGGARSRLGRSSSNNSLKVPTSASPPQAAPREDAASPPPPPPPAPREDAASPAPPAPREDAASPAPPAPREDDERSPSKPRARYESH